MVCKCKSSIVLIETACKCKSSKVLIETVCKCKSSKVLIETVCKCKSSKVLIETVCKCKSGGKVLIITPGVCLKKMLFSRLAYDASIHIFQCLYLGFIISLYSNKTRRPLVRSPKCSAPIQWEVCTCRQTPKMFKNFEFVLFTFGLVCGHFCF